MRNPQLTPGAYCGEHIGVRTHSMNAEGSAKQLLREPLGTSRVSCLRERKKISAIQSAPASGSRIDFATTPMSGTSSNSPPLSPATALAARASRGFRALGASIAGWATVRMFREDRLLLILTALLAVVTALPILVTTFLPLIDLGSNIGAAGLMDDIILRRGVPARHYFLTRAPIPYWTGYVIMGLLDVIGGPIFAANGLVLLVVVLLPISVMRLLRALDRSPRAGLFAFVITWDVNLYWGWSTFQLGMALGLFALAWFAEVQKTRDGLRVLPLVAAVALTHIHAAVLVGFAGLLMAPIKRRPLQMTLAHVIGLSGFAVLLPWVLPTLLAPAAEGTLHINSPPITERLARLFEYSLDTMPSVWGVRWAAAAFLLLIVGPAALGGLTARRPASPSRGTGMAFVFLFVCLTLYLALPFEMYGPDIEHWWTYPRYSTYVLLGLLLLPAPALAGRMAWALAPAIVITLGLASARVEQFKAYDDRTRPYLAIIEGIEPHSTFLPLDMDDNWSGTRYASLGQLHGYAAAARSSFDPHLFDHKNAPVRFRRRARLPIPDWRRIPQTFSMEQMGRAYDYLIVHPKASDFLPRLAPNEVQLVRESGEWRLYKVVRQNEPAGSDSPAAP